jgi:CheY-like chemotaxis protein
LGDPWSWRLARMLNKVPEVTLAFWVIKIMSTTVGETGADYLAVHVGLGAAITDGIMLTLLVASLLMQLRARQYVPWRYWLTFVLVSVVGTQITDFLTDKLDISLYVSTIVFAIALAVTFAVWYAVERTLSTEGGHHVLIVDRMLPGLDGIGLVQALRGTGVKAPVLFLTALGGVGDRVRGLDAGGDDYLVKPFAFAELLARINALARRSPTRLPCCGSQASGSRHFTSPCSPDRRSSWAWRFSLKRDRRCSSR